MGIYDRDYYREDSRWHNPFARSQATIVLIVVYVGLYVAADELRLVTSAGAGLLDAFKLLVFCCWVVVAWRCSTNVDASGWTLAARAALVLSVGVTGVTL